MQLDNRYKGIFYMLLAALGFSLMGGAAKLLKGSFGAGQLVFWRNLVGILALGAGFLVQPPVNKGGKFRLLVFRGNGPGEKSGFIFYGWVSRLCSGNIL